MFHRMIDSELKPFEGMWLTSQRAGSIACAKIIDGQLYIPYSHSEDKKLAGHYFDCRIVGKTLFARFERFGSGESGVMFLAVGDNFTLKGGCWTDDLLPDAVRRNITTATVSLPKMIEMVWVLMPKAKIPSWARQYFLEWPGK